MNTRELEYLIAVADHLHFGKAAEYCHVSQPTLSSQLKKFEDRVGGQCFERSKRGVRITPLGVRMVQQARKLQGELERLFLLPKEDARRDSVLNIGVAPNILNAILPMAARAIQSGSKRHEVHLTEACRTQLYTRLQEGAFDVVIDSVLGCSSESIGTTTLYNEGFCLVVPKSHPYVGRSGVTTRDLEATDLLLLESTQAEVGAALDLPRSRVCGVHVQTVLDLVLATNTPALIPEQSIHSIPSALHLLPIDESALSRQVSLHWHKSHLQTQMAWDIANQIQQCNSRSVKLPVFEQSAD